MVDLSWSLRLSFAVDVAEVSIYICIIYVDVKIIIKIGVFISKIWV